ncbi:DUF3541 domain-containing protein [uncultured Shewanella sp.]|uniref:DUF3541 domain-containing protein n=1 Tax=uncultured Shewanella sp. TaxID=173975 RepID=UPI002639FF50|nr:DUF3541 domain-containing protein [uncultured Shewanella sp.]
MYKLVLCLFFIIYSDVTFSEELTQKELTDAAFSIREKYNAQLYKLPASKMSHYGLRMFRQSGNDAFNTTVWVDMALKASSLNKINENISSEKKIESYANEVNSKFKDTDPIRRQLRVNSFKIMPEYLLIASRLLPAMARIDEYGLKHVSDKKFRQIILSQDFKLYFSDPNMIRAWAAQLANQVYWLKQLKIENLTDYFASSFREVYPDKIDNQLTDQQYNNKLYGMTHFIFPASNYYQKPVNEDDFKWIYDYFRKNIDTILERSKADVIAEVGISFLLANKENDPVVKKVKEYIYHSIDKSRKIIPSETGSFDLAYGEHRNVLAIMLLDWQGTYSRPTYKNNASMFTNLPYGLEVK